MYCFRILFMDELGLRESLYVASWGLVVFFATHFVFEMLIFINYDRAWFRIDVKNDRVYLINYGRIGNLISKALFRKALIILTSKRTLICTTPNTQRGVTNLFNLYSYGTLATFPIVALSLLLSLCPCHCGSLRLFKGFICVLVICEKKDSGCQ